MHSSLKVLDVRGEAKPMHLKVGGESGGGRPQSRAEGHVCWIFWGGNVSEWGCWGQSPSHWATQRHLLTRRQRALKPPGGPETINKWMDKCDGRRMQKKSHPEGRKQTTRWTKKIFTRHMIKQGWWMLIYRAHNPWENDEQFHREEAPRLKEKDKERNTDG